jgi:hypothetical protein
MTIGLLPDAVKPGIHCVRTHWIRGFMAFCRAGRTGGPSRGVAGWGWTGADRGVAGWAGRGLTAGWGAGGGRSMGGWNGWCLGREGGCLVTLIHSGLLTNGRATEW